MSFLPRKFVVWGGTGPGGSACTFPLAAVSLVSQALRGGTEGPAVLTLYVSQFLKKLTEPSRRLWMTVQPPGSCRWSHHTCMSRLVFSGFTR